MVSTVILRTLAFSTFLLFTAIISGTNQSSLGWHDRLYDISEEQSTTDYEEDDYSDFFDYFDLLVKRRRNIPNRDSFSDEESSGDREPVGTDTENSNENLENTNMKKTKFSNQMEKADKDIEQITTTEDSTTPPEKQTPEKMTNQEHTHTIESSTLPLQTTEGTTLKSSTVLQTSVKTTTTSEPATTSSTHECSIEDCERMTVEVSPKFQSLLPGGDFSLLCRETSNISQSLEFKWYLDDEGNLSRIADENTELLHQEAELKNAGKYVCVVNDMEKCCEKSAKSIVVIYEKPNYWLHFAVLAGTFLGLLFLVCLPITVKLQRKYLRVASHRTPDHDKQPLTF